MEPQSTQDLETLVPNLRAENEKLILENQRLQNESIGKSECVEAHESLHGRVFTCFTLLPPELQDRIWQFTVPQSIIEIRSIGDGRTFELQCHEEPLPVISRVCHASRKLFLRENFLLQLSEDDEEFEIPGDIDESEENKESEGDEDNEDDIEELPTFHHQRRDRRPIYFNPLLDTLFISPAKLGRFTDRFLPNLPRILGERIARCNTGNTEKWCIRNIAFDDHLLIYFGLFHPEKRLFPFDEFSALEEVTCVVNCWPIGRRDDFQSNVITNPFDELTQECWEETLEKFGRIMDLEAYKKFSGLRVSIACMGAYRVGGKIKDNRQGFSIIGPSNRSKYSEAF